MHLCAPGNTVSHCFSKFFNMIDQSCLNFSNEDEKNLSDNDVCEERVCYRKFRSIKRKHGVRKKVCLQRNVDIEDLDLDNGGALASSSTARIYLINDQEERNASFDQLMNSSFNSDDVGTLTRSTSASGGLRNSSNTSSSEVCVFFDKKLLINTITNAAICQGSRILTAQLSLVFCNRKALAETCNIDKR